MRPFSGQLFFSKRKLGFISSGIFTMLILSAVNAFSQNLVTNGSFNAFGASWTFFAPAIGTEAYNPETSYGGTVTTNIIGEIDNQANLRQTNIAVTAGTTYFLSFRYTRRTIGGAPNPTGVRVKVYDGATTFLTQDIIVNNTNWAWQCEVLQFTPTTNTVTLDFENTTPTISTLGTILDDITITPTEQPLVFTGNICQGGSFTLSAPQSDADNQYSNFSWTGPNGFVSTNAQIGFSNIQPSMNGTYTCTMTLNGCLQVTGSYILTVTPGIINITENICAGETYNFYGEELYQQGVYDTLILSNNDACDSLVILQLNVHPLPDVTVLPASDINLCIGQTSIIKVNAVASSSYQWLKNGQPIAGETGTQYQVSQPGNYSVKVSTSGQCIDTSTDIKVTYFSPPSALIDVDVNQDLCISDTITLRAPLGAAVYEWLPENIFRDATDYNAATGKAIVPHDGTKIKLIVYNEIGCTASDSVTIAAKPCCMVFVPNAFTPNKDGINDYIKPMFERDQIVNSFYIADRWGHCVYNNTAIKDGWDGNYPDGSPAVAGVYMFIMKYTCSDHKILEKKGDITLIR